MRQRQHAVSVCAMRFCPAVISSGASVFVRVPFTPSMARAGGHRSFARGSRRVAGL